MGSSIFPLPLQKRWKMAIITILVVLSELQAREMPTTHLVLRNYSL